MSGALVIGAGVVGLTSALALAERGAKVTVVERAHDLGGGASWLAGGMLAPFCEGESAPASVVALGNGAIDWWDARVPGVKREGTLVVAPPRDASEIDRFAARTKGHERADEARIAALEPDLAGRFRKGLFFADEGHLDPRAAMRALVDRLRALGVEIRFGEDGERLAAEADVVVDCRGFAARPRSAGPARRARRDDPRAHPRGRLSRARCGSCIRAFPSTSCRGRTASS